jgi:hypothetical protein
VTPIASTALARVGPAGRSAGRARLGRGASTWAIVLVALLAFKSFVPMLAVLSAAMQGKAVADVCAVYGVRLAPGAVVDHAAASHAVHHVHGAAEAPWAASGATVPQAPPADHVGHARDHCALSGVALAAMLAPALWGPADWAVPATVGRGVAASVPSLRDASARWLSLRGHAPPPRA